MSIKVAVLRGGVSSGYDDSLKTGGHILSLIREMPECYEPIDIFISKDGEWHSTGLTEEPHKILSKADVVWSTLHGSYGEGGRVQSLLENLQIPFVGSRTLSSVLSNNKAFAKKLYRDYLLLTPTGELIDEENFSEEKLASIFRKYFYPVVVKPANGVKALGVRLAHTLSDLKDAIRETFKHSPKVLVEEYVSGIVASCLVVEGVNRDNISINGENLYSFIPAVLEMPLRKGNLSVEESRKIGEMAKTAHSALGLRHYSSSDFIISPNGKIYIIETNSIPVIHEDSLLYKSMATTGWRPLDFVDHCLRLVLKK